MTDDDVKRLGRKMAEESARQPSTCYFNPRDLVRILIEVNHVSEEEAVEIEKRVHAGEHVQINGAWYRLCQDDCPDE